MRYKVTRKYTRGPETTCAEFLDLYDAQFFIEKKLSADADLNVKVIYCLFDGDKGIGEFDPNKNDYSSRDERDSQGKGQTSSFRPTPLDMTPRPPGTPPIWIKDDEDSDKKK
jgi:hypothetical protein